MEQILRWPPTCMGFPRVETPLLNLASAADGLTVSATSRIGFRSLSLQSLAPAEGGPSFGAFLQAAARPETRPETSPRTNLAKSPVPEWKSRSPRPERAAAPAAPRLPVRDRAAGKKASGAGNSPPPAGWAREPLTATRERPGPAAATAPEPVRERREVRPRVSSREDDPSAGAPAAGPEAWRAAGWCEGGAHDASVSGPVEAANHIGGSTEDDLSGGAVQEVAVGARAEPGRAMADSPAADDGLAVDGGRAGLPGEASLLDPAPAARPVEAATGVPSSNAVQDGEAGNSGPLTGLGGATPGAENAAGHLPAGEPGRTRVRRSDSRNEADFTGDAVAIPTVAPARMAAASLNSAESAGPPGPLPPDAPLAGDQQSRLPGERTGGPGRLGSPEGAPAGAPLVEAFTARWRNGTAEAGGSLAVPSADSPDQRPPESAANAGAGQPATLAGMHSLGASQAGANPGSMEQEGGAGQGGAGQGRAGHGRTAGTVGPAGTAGGAGPDLAAGLAWNEDSGGRPASSGSLNQASSGSPNQASSGSVNQASSGSLNQASGGSVNQSSSGSLNQVSSDSLDPASNKSPDSNGNNAAGAQSNQALGRGPHEPIPLALPVAARAAGPFTGAAPLPAAALAALEPVVWGAEETKGPLTGLTLEVKVPGREGEGPAAVRLEFRSVGPEMELVASSGDARIRESLRDALPELMGRLTPGDDAAAGESAGASSRNEAEAENREPGAGGSGGGRPGDGRQAGGEPQRRSSGGEPEGHPRGGAAPLASATGRGLAPAGWREIWRDSFDSAGGALPSRAALPDRTSLPDRASLPTGAAGPSGQK